MPAMESRRLTEWVLRIGAAGEFFGHGYFAWSVRGIWVPFITLFGFDEFQARAIMPWVGALDFFLAALVLVRPVRLALAWMAFWGLFTASLRPLTGQPIFEMIERFPNFAVPLALLLLRGWPRRRGEWLS